MFRKGAYWRDGGGQIDALGESHLSLLKGARKVYIAKLLAEVCGCGEKLDETVFDNQLDVGALFNGLLDCTRGCDEKLLAAIGNH